MEELKALIEEQLLILSCETHPAICRLRDESKVMLIDRIATRLLNSEEDYSVQSVIAELEMELAQ